MQTRTNKKKIIWLVSEIIYFINLEESCVIGIKLSVSFCLNGHMLHVGPILFSKTIKNLLCMYKP